MAPVEARERVAREALDQLGRTDHLSAVRVALEEMRVELTPEPAARIVVAQAHLLQDDFFLLLEHVGVERCVHRDVGEHFEPGHHAPRGQRDVIEGVVPRGAGVHPAADALDVALHEPARAGRGTAKQHVLEVVREPELGGALVARAGAHPQLQRDDVAAPMLLDDDRNAVGKDVTRRAGRCGRGPRDGPNGAASPTHREGHQRQSERRHPDHKP